METSKLLEEYRDIHAGDFQRVETQMEDLNKKVDAHMVAITQVITVFNSFQGFGKVIAWIGKWILVPAIMLLGAILTYKQIKE